MENNDVQQSAARAIGRTWGALFFSVFGGAWLFLSVFAYGVMKPLSLAAIAIVVALLVAVAIKIQKRAKKVPPEPEDEARKRDHRSFGIINAVQWAAVFLVFMFFPRLGLANWIFPAMLFIVGAHFFFMPPSYRHSSSYLTGALLCIWAIACPLVVPGSPLPNFDPRVGALAGGAGVVLWTNAAWALRSAHLHLERARL